jgi:galactokinase/mevalonate kinase-like predicted kinase
VPESFRTHFQAGLEKDHFAFKLCGSGGGGFMLCFAAEAKMATDYLRAEHLSFIELTHDN